STKDLEKVVYFAPTRRREPVHKVVIEGRRTDLLKRGDLISASEERIHRHYDHKFKSEEAFRVIQADDVPVNEGDVISAEQVGLLKRNFGDSLFHVEPAFRVIEASGDGRLETGHILSRSELDSLRKEGPEPAVERAMAGNQEGFVVTAVSHLPFSKG
ncbi:MAG TPA: hypothetical protein DCE03_00470, partial [Synergistaceae bacterium]|nr:hypothetical protein [Synergistaceae bacterium]